MGKKANMASLVLLISLLFVIFNIQLAKANPIAYGPPKIAIVSPQSGFTYNSSQVTLTVEIQLFGYTYTSLEVINWARYAVDSGVTAPLSLDMPREIGPGTVINSTDTISNLSDGDHTISIFLETSFAENANANVTFKIDTEPIPTPSPSPTSSPAQIPTPSTSMNFPEPTPSLSNANTVAYSPIKNGLQLSISLDPNQIFFPQYPQGYIANVSLMITNVSNQTRNFASQQSSNIFNFRVYNSTDSKELYSWISSAYPIYDVNVSLAPGENYSGCYVWGEMGGYNVGEYPLPPGNYYVIGETGVNQPHEFQTAPLNITIFASATPTPEVIVGSPTSASPTQKPTSTPVPRVSPPVYNMQILFMAILLGALVLVGLLASIGRRR